jgi:putative hydrolase of the HAD superfamily
VKAVIFDLDDTLFDHTGSAVGGLRAWVPGFGREVTDDLVAEWFAIEHRHYNEWLAGRLTHQGQRRARLLDFLPLIGQSVPGTDDELDVVFAGYLEGYREHWIAFPDAHPALEVARGNGWRVGVLTNGSTVQQHAKLERIGLAQLVDVVCTSESLGCSKPAVQAYHLTCEALGVEPADTLMIGDNLELDVIAARAAGLTAEHLDRAAGGTLDQLIKSKEG